MLSFLLLGAFTVGLMSMFGGAAAQEDGPTYFEEDEDGNTTMIGWDGDDRIVGASHDDVILGLEGDDTLIGGAGNDEILDGPGNDILKGFAGDDTLIGSEEGSTQPDSGPAPGNDQLFGGAGDDLLIATSGHDRLFGGIGRDILDGWSTSDAPDGQALLVGGRGADLLIGGPGDTLWGGGIDAPDQAPDRFAVVMDDPQIGPAVIKDLDPDLDSLFLILPVPMGETANPDKLIATTRDTNQGMEVVVDEEVIALVQGVVVADNITIGVRTLTV